MGFFGIGTGEILLVIVVALIIWGPRRLPEITRTLGKAVRTLRKTTFDLTNAVTREIDSEKNENSHQPSPKPNEHTAVEPPSKAKKPLTRRKSVKKNKPEETSGSK